MKNKIIGILTFITLVTSFIIVSPADDIETVDIDSYLNGIAQTQFTSVTGLTFGSEYVFNSANTNNVSIASLTSTKFVIAYSDTDNSYYGTAVIGDISGNTITYGSEYVFNSANTNNISVSALNSTKFVVAFSDVDVYGYHNGTAVIGDVSGNTITFGAEYVFNFWKTSPIAVTGLTSDRFVVAYGNHDYMGRPFVALGDVTGNTITYPFIDRIEDFDDPIWYISIDAINSQEFIVVLSLYFIDNCAIIGTIFEDSIIFHNPMDTFYIGEIFDYCSVATLSENFFVIAFSDSYHSEDCYAIIGERYGNIVDYGPLYELNPDNSHFVSVTALNSTKFVIVYKDMGNSGNGTAVICERFGQLISDISEEYIFNPDITSSISVVNLSVNKFVIAYEDNGNSGYGTAIIGYENQPPNNPDTPDGPSVLGFGETGTYNTSGIEPDGDQLQYRFDWDADGAHDYSDWTSLDSSGHIGSLQNDWTIGGTYVVKAQARDEYDSISGWSSGYTVNIISPPLTPTIPSGPTNLGETDSGMYSTSAIDPDDNRVQYRFDWGDGTISDWTILVDSGQPGSKSHFWIIPDTYYLRSQARDEYGYNSGWSDSLAVEITGLPELVAYIHGHLEVMLGQTITLHGSASGGKPPYSFSWDFGDTSIGNGETVNHKYASLGTYTVTLTVEDDRGVIDTDAKNVEVNMGERPSVQLIYPTGGEILNDLVKIEWSAYDEEDGNNLKIYLYLSSDNGDSWVQFDGNPQNNDGEYNWDTKTLPDGAYKIMVVGQDSHNQVNSVTSESFQIKNHDEPPENNAPDKPARPTGETEGKIDEEYTFSTSASDPEGDQVYYKWDWGDETSGWIGPYNSGELCESSHIWDDEGSYDIKVKAKDQYGDESPWSDPLSVSMPKKKSFNNIPKIILWLFERFPFLQPYFSKFIV